MEEGVSDVVESTRGVLRALEALSSEHRRVAASEGLALSLPDGSRGTTGVPRDDPVSI